MIPTEELENALKIATTHELHHHIPLMVHVIQSIADKKLSIEEAQQQITADFDLQNIAQQLSGKTITTSNTVVSFGENSQLGDFSVRDLAGRDIVNLNIALHFINSNTETPLRHPTSNIKQLTQKISPSSLIYLIIGTTIIVMILFSVGRLSTLYVYLFGENDKSTDQTIISSPTQTLETSNTSVKAVCDWRRLIPKEVLVRERPGISTSVVATLDQNTVVSVFCNSEEMLFGVSWNEIATASSRNTVIKGWIPSQDIGYPKVCTEIKIAIDGVFVRENPSMETPSILLLSKNDNVGVICDTEKTINQLVWVRIRAILTDGAIVMGWALSSDIVRKENVVIVEGHSVPKLGFTRLNINEEPTCITIQILGIASTNGWSVRVDGIPHLGESFVDTGFARVCGLAPQQEATISVFDATGSPINGGIGMPARGGDIFRANWR